MFLKWIQKLRSCWCCLVKRLMIFGLFFSALTILNVRKKGLFLTKQFDWCTLRYNLFWFACFLYLYVKLLRHYDKSVIIYKEFIFKSGNLSLRTNKSFLKISIISYVDMNVAGLTWNTVSKSINLSFSFGSNSLVLRMKFIGASTLVPIEVRLD